MSLEQMREQNKQKAVAAALACFVEYGIENTKIKEVAQRAGLTERSLYRYFETKSDLVWCAALLFWDENVQRAEDVYAQCEAKMLNGAQQIESILLTYAELYFSDRNRLIFVQEAEAYLYKNGKCGLLHNRPPAPFPNCNVPLAKALQKGLLDGTVKQSCNMESMYYNAYDALLGLMQNMAVGESAAMPHPVDPRKRLQDFCRMLTAALTGNAP